MVSHIEVHTHDHFVNNTITSCPVVVYNLAKQALYRGQLAVMTSIGQWDILLWCFVFLSKFPVVSCYDIIVTP